MIIPTFKARCSKLGAIMTNPRSKTEILSETTKTYLIEWILEKKYGRKKEFSNKYLEKGLTTEQD